MSTATTLKGPVTILPDSTPADPSNTLRRRVVHPKACLARLSPACLDFDDSLSIALVDVAHVEKDRNGDIVLRMKRRGAEVFRFRPQDRTQWFEKVMRAAREANAHMRGGSAKPFSDDLKPLFAIELSMKEKTRGKLGEDLLWAMGLFLVCVAHAWGSPFTKVEESFNVQAVYDLRTWPAGLVNQDVVKEKFDHVEFPGVVPRTFCGALVLAVLGDPVYAVMRWFPLYTNYPDRVMELMAARLALGSLVVFSVFRLARMCRKHFGTGPTRLMWLLLCTQFHIPFYATRMLPNTFAMVLTTLASAELVDDHAYRTVAFLVVSAIVFRCDTIVLLAPTAVWIWIASVDGEMNEYKTLLKNGFKLFFVALFWTLVSLLATTYLDSKMWLRSFPFWPEGQVLIFNTVLDKSAQWGTSPFHWYISNALPRTLLVSFPCVIFGLFFASNDKQDGQRLARVLIPALAFVFLYSFLPHKEVRFMFLVLPTFTMAAAVGANDVMNRVSDAGLMSKQLRRAIVAAAVIACAIGSFTFSYVSSQNYPAGYALRDLHLGLVGKHAFVHVDAYSAMSGISRFGYFDAAAYGGQKKLIRYSKSEDENLDLLQFTHLLTNREHVPGFRVMYAEQGEPQLDLRKRQINMNNAVYVMEKESANRA